MWMCQGEQGRQEGRRGRGRGTPVLTAAQATAVRHQVAPEEARGAAAALRPGAGPSIAACSREAVGRVDAAVEQPP